jgi:hypothetical protein
VTGLVMRQPEDVLQQLYRTQSPGAPTCGYRRFPTGFEGGDAGSRQR